MLNELFSLAECLQKGDVTIASWHRLLKECPQGTKTFQLEITDAGEIFAVRPIVDRERLKALRKYEKAAGYSFPAMNLPPLWQFKNAEVKTQAAKFRKALASKAAPSAAEIAATIGRLLEDAQSGWIKPDKGDRGKDELDQLNDCLTRVTADLQAILGTPPDSCSAFAELVHRAQNLCGKHIHEKLTAKLVELLKQQPDAVEYFDLLFFTSGKSPKKAAFVFEVAEQSQFEYPANHQHVYHWVNQQLMAHDSAMAEKLKTPPSTDAFGATDGGTDDAFPEVKMSCLGKVNLRAMNSESPCQRRYGVADAESFVVSTGHRQLMKNALEWISREERRGKTWSDITSLGGGSAVLFAHPAELPPTPPELSLLFVGDTEDPYADTGRFEACAQRVISSLQGLVASTSRADIRVFVLTKPDGFRTKVLHSGRYTVDRVIASALLWQQGCHNVPRILIRDFGVNKGDRPTSRSPAIPYPAEVVWCLNTRWRRLGSHAEQCRGFKIVDALTLLLDEGVALTTTVTRALRAMYSNCTPLFVAMGQAHLQQRVLAVPKQFARQKHLLPSILGLLLSKLEIEKGTYMNSPPVLVGRFLSLADQLHLQYCQGVRNGQVPPQLVGNALMATALEQPIKAIAMLSQRLLPYQAWARTLHGGEKVGLVKYILGQLGRVSAQLAEGELPHACSDADRAIMFLGYLSRPEKGAESESVSEANEDIASA